MDLGLTFWQAVGIVGATATLAVVGRALAMRVALPIALALMAVLALVVGSLAGTIVVVTALGLALLVGAVIRTSVEAREQHADLVAAAADRPVPAAASWQNPDGLTPREVDVLQLIAAGRNNQEIAAELHISMATVKTHVNHIFTKTTVRDRAQAVAYAFQQGLGPGAGGDQPAAGPPPQG